MLFKRFYTGNGYHFRTGQSECFKLLICLQTEAFQFISLTATPYSFAKFYKVVLVIAVIDTGEYIKLNIIFIIEIVNNIHEAAYTGETRYVFANTIILA